MYVYIKSEPGLFTVGHYDPLGAWHTESDHDSREQAAERIHWLNGGDNQMVAVASSKAVDAFQSWLAADKWNNTEYDTLFGAMKELAKSLGHPLNLDA